MEEREAERGVVIDAFKSDFSAFCDLPDVMGAQVRQLLAFHIAPYLLDRIELWGIAW